MSKEFFGLGKTVWFAVIAMIGTWLGIYLNMFSAELWSTLLMVALPSLAAKSVGTTVGKTIAEKRAGKA